MSFRECLEVLELVDSTNRVLLEKSEADLKFGSSVLARQQSSGRGRAGRVWRSGLGGLYISTLLHPGYPEGLALLGALSVIELLEVGFSLNPTLRWPNDVLIGGRKIAGILPAARYRGSSLERAVLGTGLNVHQSVESLLVEGDLSTTLAAERPDLAALDVVEVGRSYLDVLESNFRALESSGTRVLAERCEAYLEGKDSEEIAVVTDDLGTNVRELGKIAGLGPLGELRFLGGETLSSLGPSERLRLRPTF